MLKKLTSNRANNVITKTAILNQYSGIGEKKNVIKCKIKLRIDIFIPYCMIVKCTKLLNVVEVGLRSKSVIKIFVKLFFD